MDKTAEAVRSLQFDRLRRALEKKAGFWKTFTSALSRPRLGETAGNIFAEGIAGAAQAAVGTVIDKGFSAAVNRVRKPKAFKAMVAANPALKKMDQKRVQQTFNTLYTLNPRLARDPLTAGSFVGATAHKAEVGGAPAAYVDIRTAQELQRAGAKPSKPVMEAWMGARPEAPKDLRTQAKMERYKTQLRQAAGKDTKLPKSPWETEKRRRGRK